MQVPDHLFTDAKAVGFPTIGWVANDAQGLQRAVQVCQPCTSKALGVFAH